MIARDILRVAQVQIQIPLPYDVAPLTAHASIQGGRRRLQVVARNPREQTERERIIESMAIIQRTQADEQMIIDLIEFHARSQIVAVADGPARTYCELRAELH